MNTVTSQHEYAIGRFHLSVGSGEVALHDTSDNQRVVLREEMTIAEMQELARALYKSAVIREKMQELLDEEIRFDHEQEMLEEVA